MGVFVVAAARARASFRHERRERGGRGVVEHHRLWKLHRELGLHLLFELDAGERVETGVHERLVGRDVATEQTAQDRHYAFPNRLCGGTFRLRAFRFLGGGSPGPSRFRSFPRRLLASAPRLLRRSFVYAFDAHRRRRFENLGESIPRERTRGDVRRGGEYGGERGDAILGSQHAHAHAFDPTQHAFILRRHAHGAPRAPLYARGDRTRLPRGGRGAIERGVCARVVRLSRAAQERGDGGKHHRRFRRLEPRRRRETIRRGNLRRRHLANPTRRLTGKHGVAKYPGRVQRVSDAGTVGDAKSTPDVRRLFTSSGVRAVRGDRARARAQIQTHATRTTGTT